MKSWKQRKHFCQNTNVLEVFHIFRGLASFTSFFSAISSQNDNVVKLRFRSRSGEAHSGEAQESQEGQIPGPELYPIFVFFLIF